MNASAARHRVHQRPWGHRFLAYAVAALLLSLLAAAHPRVAAAQTNTAEISGMVVDDQGGLLPGASVTATHLASGRRTEALTDSAGRFFLPGLSVGSYDLTVHLDGFRAALQSNIVLALGQRLDLSFRLAVGGVAETITVTGAAPLLQTTSAEVAEVVRNQQVVNLPLNGRQFLQLALLTDNVVVPPGGTRGAALQQAGSLFSVAGQRSGHNIYLLDGVKVTDEYFNNLVVSPSVDAIQEFKIQSNTMSAEFGFTLGGWAIFRCTSRSSTTSRTARPSGQTARFFPRAS